ncbi:DUF1223 domain-containing protein [Aurantiacibacter sp. D1-12]|uniref:DUF1223 domain-containing protein n=1 Tax=Aurantiacibacter sp. D1-12 TaxID=2993658 RepID=UPI00237CE1BA|nr:DUF1223 domain-containing protein [Aurantiacibacter sp. D1-12]MDE1468248.1 DUF1223 domain-containing protein [Aurantiacibacter sp. D1-12]
MKYVLGLAAAAVLAMICGFVLYMDREMEAAQVAEADLPPVQADVSPVVLELFTSQSCSSCPPADALARELAQRDDVIVITRPVTYWNRIGWVDTLSNERNTELQRAYARRGLEGYNGVYTPQIVINGMSGDVGSRANSVAEMIRAAQAGERPDITVSDNGEVEVRGSAPASAELVIVAVDGAETVEIASGENRNRTVTYTNTWLGEAPIGSWNGGDAAFDLPATMPLAGEADAYAIILRESTQTGAGQILAGRWL